MIFPAKLLLFGEYTVLRGSQALAMPLSLYSGQWQQSEPLRIDDNLLIFNAYLENLVNEGKLAFDTEGCQKAISEGQFFASTIPNGYGAGSSGAVTAALLARFGLYNFEKITDADLPKLKAILGLMESHFHGSSSGFDPLVSFVKKPILIKSDKTMRILKKVKTDLCIFLIDTKQPRKTEPLVKLFLEKCESNSAYNTLIENELAPRVDDAIAALLYNKSDFLFETVHHISHFQQRFFNDMIPLAFKQIWLEGLASDVFKLKLCGAGGGGFILGFTKNKVLAKAELAKFGFQMIEIQ